MWGKGEPAVVIPFPSLHRKSCMLNSLCRFVLVGRRQQNKSRQTCRGVFLIVYRRVFLNAEDAD